MGHLITQHKSHKGHKDLFFFVSLVFSVFKRIFP